MLFVKCVIVVEVKLSDQIPNSPITLIHVPEVLLLNWRPRGPAHSHSRGMVWRLRLTSKDAD